MSAGYEKKDINVKKSVIVGLLIVLFIVVSLIGVNELFTYEKEKIIYNQVLKPESISLKELKAREDSILTSYELVDTVKQYYRIPLDSAKALTAQELNGN